VSPLVATGSIESSFTNDVIPPNNDTPPALFTPADLIRNIPILSLLNSHTCSSGVVVRAGAGRAAVGFNYNSRSGLNPTGRIALFQFGPATAAASAGPGNVRPTVSIRIPETPISVGGGPGPGDQVNLNIGVRLGNLVTAQVYQNQGTEHSFY
jgi:hypothetical protein